MTNPIAILVMTAIILLGGIMVVSVASDDIQHERANDFDEIVTPIFETTAWLPLLLGGVVLIATASLIAAAGGGRP